MELVLCKENGQTIIQENGHAIYTIEEEKEQGLLCVYLKNMYGEEVLGMYQIQNGIRVLSVNIRKILQFMQKMINKVKCMVLKKAMKWHGRMFFIAFMVVIMPPKNNLMY